jgi:molybdopterin molybdotransferase
MALIPVREAVERVLSGVVPAEAETVPLADAIGRVLAAPLAALRMQPPFPASAMDGYAVRAADAKPGAMLKLIGASIAGNGFGGRVGPGETIRIFTGAPVPEGADAILIQENAEAGESAVKVLESPVTGRHIRPAGLDFRKGDTPLAAGRILESREISLAAAMNHASVPVRRRPVVGILATGDELVPPGGTPGPDQIVASNTFGIAALVAKSGGVARDLGIARDDRAAIARVVDDARASGADILVTLGGASVGEHDLIGAVLQERGMALDFWKIAMRPGKPLIFGRLGEMRVLGLPGNPVSSLVCGILFLQPLIGALLGRPYVEPGEPAVLGADMPPNDARDDYVRATLARASDGTLIATPLSVQDSSMLSTLAAADCLLVRPANALAGKRGDRCRVVRLG